MNLSLRRVARPLPAIPVNKIKLTDAELTRKKDPPLNPLISVVIPCYNHGAYLDDAVDSVLAQTLADIEIIIVNDGSTDLLTIEKLKTYSRPGVRVIHTANQGLAAARNNGIAVAKGNFILPLDADDVIDPTYLEKACTIMQSQPEIGIVYCQAEFFGEKTGKWNLPPYSLDLMLVRNVIFSAALFRREDWEKTGGYNAAIRRCSEDWDFWLSLLQAGKEVYQIPEVLFHYRISTGAMHSLRMFWKLMVYFTIIGRHWRFYLVNIPKVMRGIMRQLLLPSYRQ